ncbi:MAG: aspartate kinase [Planctomycetota bacterium]|nr:aspartate kinase [Planctomycetota bacterium]
MIIMKFGGSSLADCPCLEHVASLVKSFDEPKALVVSALGKSTDRLLQLGLWAEKGQTEQVKSGLNALRLDHEEAFPDLENPAEDHEQLFTELSSLLEGIQLLREQTPRSKSLLASFGERLSIHVVAAHLKNQGLRAQAIDARELIETADNGQNGPVDFVQSSFKCQEVLLPLLEDGVIPVITGFLARNKVGFTTTLGRGGSDYTATILGQIMKAREVWIWTDVSGILSADPRLVKNAHTLPQVSYREASEMSFFGAKVLHPKTIAPVARQNIPVRILNTFKAKDPGTLISADTPKSLAGVKTVATMHGLSLITIEGRGMAGRPGIARRIFEATELAGCNVVMISQASSEQSVSFVVSQNEVPELVNTLKSRFAFELDQGLIESIGIVEPIAIASIIGLGMSGTPGISGRFFGALGKVGVNV